MDILFEGFDYIATSSMAIIYGINLLVLSDEGVAGNLTMAINVDTFSHTCLPFIPVFPKQDLNCIFYDVICFVFTQPYT